MEEEIDKKEEQKEENDNQINIDDKQEEKLDEEQDNDQTEEKEKEKKEDIKDENKDNEKTKEEKQEKHEEKEEMEDNKEENEEKGKEDEKEDEKEDKKEKKGKKHKKEKKEKKKKKEKTEKNKEKKNLILTIDEENNTCVDCGKSSPTKVSINNGVIICEECSLKHEELGHSISFIKDIEEDFDEYLLNFIVFGSNSKFKRFLNTENVDPSLPTEKKYLTKACFFYRNNLKRKVQGEELLKEKNYEDPNEIIEIENIEDNYPEFEHYKMKSKIIHDGSLKQKQNTTLNKLSGSILSFGKKMYGGIKSGANFVAKKTEGPTKTITKGAKMGAGFVGKQMNHAYEIIKKNVIKGKKNQNTENEGDMNKNPPNLDKNENNIMESGRPLQAGDEVKEENVEGQKERNENEIKQEQEADNNEEKIDI